MYPAVGDGARPTLIMLHGIPGSEKNLDIAYRLRELGWHTLIIHFRGAWGSDGDYDLTAQPDDAIAAVDFLLNTSADWQVDPAHIAVLGYSLGSRAAIVAAHRDPRIKALISLSGIADFDELMFSPEFLTSAAQVLRGVTLESLNAQWAKLGGAENPINIIGQITCPTLIIHGTQDEVIPYWMAPALHEASGKRATFQTIENADHTFTQHRTQLVEGVVGWLTQ
jgi:pimeloyl-ACP methyl ester carboxylesterase